MKSRFFCMISSTENKKEQLRKRIKKTLEQLPKRKDVQHKGYKTQATAIQGRGCLNDYDKKLKELKTTIMNRLNNKNQDDNDIKKKEDKYVQVLCANLNDIFPNRPITFEKCMKAVNASGNYKILEMVITLVYLGGVIMAFLLLSIEIGAILLVSSLALWLVCKCASLETCLPTPIGHKMSNSQKNTIRKLNQVNGWLSELQTLSDSEQKSCEQIKPLTETKNSPSVA